MKRSGFKMKGSPMQRNFGIGSPLKTGQKTKGKLKKKYGPHPKHDQDGDGVPDILQVDPKNKKTKSDGEVKKPKKTKDSTKPESPIDPKKKKKKKKTIQMPNPNVRPTGYGLDR